MFDDFKPGDEAFWQEPDFLLADIISGFVNKGGMELGITLYVKGLVVTGTLISEHEYLLALSAMFTSQAKKTLVNPTKREMKMTEEVFDFTGLAEDVESTEREDDDSDNSDESDVEERPYPAIRYLHLKDPVIIQPQPAVSFTHTQVSILRIRLTTIDGWMIGKVTMDGDDLMDGFPPVSPNEIRH